MKLPLNQLTLDGKFQIRSKLEQARIEEFEKIFDRLPPSDVAKVNGTYYLLDGWHRHAAAKRLGLMELEVNVHDLDEDGAYEFAGKANAMSAMPLKAKDRKKFAKGLLVRFTERSNNWLADDCGLSVHTVIGLRNEMESNLQIAIIDTLLTKDGRKIPRGNEQKPAQDQPPVDDQQPPEKEPEPDREPEPDKEPEPEPTQKGLFDQENDGLGDDEPKNDDQPPVKVEPVRLPGVEIWNVDARKLPSYVTDPVHLVVTSPPYNVGTEYDRHEDAQPLDDFLEMLNEVWTACYRVMVSGARIAVVVPFGIGRNPWTPFACQVMETLQICNFELRGQIIWDKGTSGGRTTWGSFRLPTDPSLRDTSECIIVAHKGPSKLEIPQNLVRHDTEGSYSPFLENQELFMELAQDHWTVSPESKNRIDHPAPFPVQLVERLIRFYAYPGVTVLDPFAGSGTTGLAATKLGCKAVLFDISQEYCQLMRKRLLDGG